MGVNPYLSFTISAVVELLGLVMGHMVLDRFGRKYPYGICLTSSGVSCLLTIFISKKTWSNLLNLWKYFQLTLAMIVNTCLILKLSLIFYIFHLRENFLSRRVMEYFIFIHQKYFRQVYAAAVWEHVVWWLV